MSNLAGVKKFKFGLLGLGSVDREVIRRSLRSVQVNLHWISDGRCFVSRSDRKPFTGREMQRLLEIKTQYEAQFAEKCRSGLDGCEVFDFGDTSQQANLIQRELITEPRREWVIIDSSITPRNAGRMLTQSALGCACYCSANKSPWEDYTSYSALYTSAERERTLLGLNCIVGVWADQMEILPILMRRLRAGTIMVTKRDNSSLNLLFQKVWKGKQADDALAEIAAAGYLEPGDDLSLEIRDQNMKAKIAANICRILRNAQSSVNRNSLMHDGQNTGFRDASEVVD